MSIGTLVPLPPGSLLASASKELDRQMMDLVPPGKKAAAVAVVDINGVELGGAWIHETKGGLKVVATASMRREWRKAGTEASLKLKAVF